MANQGDDGSDRDRRRFLSALAAVGTTAVAGCNADSGSEPTTQPTTERTTGATETTTARETETATQPATEAASPLSLDLSVSPSTVGQYQSATATAAVSNDGDERVDGVLSLSTESERLGTPAFEVAAGDTATREVAFELGRVGSHELSVVARNDGDTVADASATVEVEPYPEHSVGVDDTTLTCGDGTAYFGGASIANVFYPAAPGESVAASFEQMAAYGITSARIWGFAPAWAEMDTIPEPYTYNDDWFDYFDRVVAEAKRHDVRLFVPIINGNPAYGPVGEEDLSVNVPQFVRWADDAESRNDFFDSDECTAMFEDWAERLLTHENHLTGVEYRNDPTIAMWELGNEIQKSPPKVGESIRPWIEDAGAFVKELDDETLLTTGSYGHQGRNAFVDEANADPVDVVSIHYYPGPSHYDLPEDEVVPTLESTIETVHEEIGKPLYVGEYNWGVQPEDSVPYEERAEWLGRLNAVLREGDVAATNLWTVGVADRPTSYHKAATIYAPNEAASLAELTSHDRAMREKSTSPCIEAEN